MFPLAFTTVLRKPKYVPIHGTRSGHVPFFSFPRIMETIEKEELGPREGEEGEIHLPSSGPPPFPLPGCSAHPNPPTAAAASRGATAASVAPVVQGRARPSSPPVLPYGAQWIPEGFQVTKSNVSFIQILVYRII